MKSRTHQLVVGGVVDHVQDAGLAGQGLRPPGEVAGVETQSTELPVASTAAHLAHQRVHTGAAQLGIGCGATEFVPARVVQRVSLRICMQQLFTYEIEL